MSEPRVIVYSSLFPSAVAPTTGTFIRERMFRVGKRVPLVIVAPQAWSPFDWLVRLVRKSFRPQAVRHEVVDGIPVYRPRVLSIPGVLKSLDGWLMIAMTRGLVRRLATEFDANLIDAHFLYPDGYAATIIGKELGLPVTITIRGSKDEWLIGTSREPYLREAVHGSTRLFAVSEALKRDVGIRLGAAETKVRVIGNGVDIDKFERLDRSQARKRLGIPEDAQVIIGVGSLIERKGFHRILPLIRELRNKHPRLLYLIVGGGASHGDMSQDLVNLARQENIEDCVRFCGAQMPTELKWYYSASDVFALATSHEGWANVFLEAMACGLPVVSTLVGGNSEVINDESLGTLVDYWDGPAFCVALDSALRRAWNRDAIVAYARSNTWERRIDVLVDEFNALTHRQADSPAADSTRLLRQAS